MIKPIKTKTMKNTLSTITITIAILFLSSCWSFREAGKLNVISSKDIDVTSNSYVLLQRDVRYTISEAKKIRESTINAACDQCIRKVEGGLFIKNVTITRIVRKGFFINTFGYIVEGDVWGVPPSK